MSPLAIILLVVATAAAAFVVGYGYGWCDHRKNGDCDDSDD
jgi:hypothetical protein